MLNRSLRIRAGSLASISSEQLQKAHIDSGGEGRQILLCLNQHSLQSSLLAINDCYLSKSTTKYRRFLATMASIADAQRYGTAFNRQAMAYNNGSNAYGAQYGGRTHNLNNYGMQQNSTDMTALAHSFQGVNLQNASYPAHAKHSMSPAGSPHVGGIPGNAAMHSTVYGSAVPYGYANTYTTAQAQGSGMYTPHASQYMHQVGYQGYQHHDNSPVSHNWTPTTATGAEVPTLITPRRDSISSNENDQPATPSYANYANLTHGSVAINRSPSGVFTHSTPSPTSIVGPYGLHMMKQPEQSDVSPRLKLLVTREPAIPRAIPAPSSPLKPLDRALENQRGETNVYIRGLLPETTDEMLEQWGRRFGDIKSSKSIIDMNSGLCKGFGFVKYHNYEDAENCIRGFHFLGYEESFYSKLKTFADEQNTNLYVSNLPKSMNEHELANLFAPHKVCSARILRDKNGHGRGVGFARFENRDACEEVIKSFNSQAMDEGAEDAQIQIRYADTQEQKQLKQQTHAARQFRSQEYEYATQAWRQGRMTSVGSSDGDYKSISSGDFDQYLNTVSAAPSQRWSNNKALPGRSPLGGVPYTNSYSQGTLSKTNNNDDAASVDEAKGPGSDAGVKVEPTSSPDDSATPAAKQE
ncbi:hypothetical protein AMS68_004587 [Peltaster fructicola]|uniref:RRM domain-containing protein n=1 Tax=Peltaster fructicola TaxID=286661 RepID=A0A6H0XXB9_9PEZI|nr:hypothetical protein AMS68_004587 [Peltaster fructicola]